MNIRDFEPISGIKFDDVFKKQKLLMTRYEPYLVNSIKEFDINTLEDQELFKAFMLVRVVEELIEATVDINNREHFEEEIIDAFNFLIESYILYGWDYSNLNPWHEELTNNELPRKNLRGIPNGQVLLSASSSQQADEVFARKNK